MPDASKTLEIVINQSGDAVEGVSSLGGLFAGLASPAGIAVAGITAIGAAAVGAGAVGVKAWSDFDAAQDALATGTGATGDELDEMSRTILDLSESSAGVNQEMETIGKTLAEVRVRTGATGKELEGLSGSILTLSRLTGGDAVKQTQLITRVMGDWGVEMENSTALVDTLFGASQAFGVNVDSLASKVVQFGAPLRQMGFTLEESVAMFGKWEKEGVNAELVIGSLRIAAGNFARDNIPLRDGLQQTMEKIKGAASESEALALAMDVFGARAGPDMAAAIREGRFELEDAIATLQETKGNLEAAGEGTLDFGDRWGLLQQKVMNAMIPVGGVIMDVADVALPGLVDALAPVIESFGLWAKDTMPLVVDIFKSFAADLKSTVGPAMVIIRDAIDRIAVALGYQTGQVDGTKIALALLKAVLDSFVIAVRVTAIAFKLFADGVEQGRRNFNAIRNAAESVGGTISSVAGSIRRAWQSATNTISEMANAIRRVANSVPRWLRPGSPPPFAVGLANIADAATRVGDTLPKAFSVGAPGAAISSTMGGGVGGGQVIVNLTYAPAISMADKFEVEAQLLPFIQNALRGR